jgi:hypothetical protein
MGGLGEVEQPAEVDVLILGGHLTVYDDGELVAAGGEELQLQRRDAVEEAFARTEGDRGDVGAELVDEAGGEVLVDRGGSSGEATSRSPAALRAWSRAESMPSVTNVKVVPPCIGSGSRGWW